MLLRIAYTLGWTQEIRGLPDEDTRSIDLFAWLFNYMS